MGEDGEFTNTSHNPTLRMRFPIARNAPPNQIISSASEIVETGVVAGEFVGGLDVEDAETVLFKSTKSTILVSESYHDVAPFFRFCWG